MGNRDLVSHLIRSGVLRTPRIVEAFVRCDRIRFVPEEYSEYAYEDRPLPIGEAQTISQPYTVAFMLELLRPEEGNRILDVGSGSGWTTALLSCCVGESGWIEGVERIDELVRLGRENLSRCEIANATIEKAPPDVLGKPSRIYERILVSASATQLPPPLIEQLAPGGILVIPIENSIWRIVKRHNGTLDSTEYPGFRFVPLVV